LLITSISMATFKVVVQNQKLGGNRYHQKRYRTNYSRLCSSTHYGTYTNRCVLYGHPVHWIPLFLTSISRPYSCSNYCKAPNCELNKQNSCIQICCCFFCCNRPSNMRINLSSNARTRSRYECVISYYISTYADKKTPFYCSGL